MYIMFIPYTEAYSVFVGCFPYIYASL